MKFLNSNQEYKEEVVKYKPTDGFLAFVLFFIICLLYAFTALLENRYSIIKEHARLAGLGINLLMILITIFLCNIRRQGMETLGLLRGHWEKSLMIGGVLAAILFFNNCLSHIINGGKFINFTDILLYGVYYLSVAVCEEIVFRGYIGTRLYGLVKNKYFAVIMAGILFIIMHFPYRMTAYGLTISDLTVHNTGWLIDLFVTHVILSFIYMKTNSLHGSILTHWMSNLAYNIVAG